MGCVQNSAKAKPVKPKQENAWTRIDPSVSSRKSRKKRSKGEKSEISNKSEKRKKKRKRKVNGEGVSEWKTVKDETEYEPKDGSGHKNNANEGKPDAPKGNVEDNVEEKVEEAPPATAAAAAVAVAAVPGVVDVEQPPKQKDTTPTTTPVSTPTSSQHRTPPKSFLPEKSMEPNDALLDLGGSTDSGHKPMPRRGSTQHKLRHKSVPRAIVRDHEPLSSAKSAKITNWILSQPRHLFVDPATLYNKKGE